jgi:trimeric autotransporter adhesin
MAFHRAPKLRLRWLGSFCAPALLPGFLVVAVVAVLPAAIARGAPVPASILLQVNRVAGSPTGVAGSLVNTGPALLSSLNQPEAVSIDKAGNLYVADTGNNQILRIDAATGTMTTVAANGLLISGTESLLSQPAGVVVDPHGNLYIADTGNHLVRYARMDTGIITIVAGNPASTPFDPRNIGDGGPATQADLDSPSALALDGAGNLYIADSGDSRVREVSSTTGMISTVVGTGVAGYFGDNIAAAQAELNHPNGIAVDTAGNLYIADTGNNLIREVDATSGVIRTVAGVAGAAAGYNGDNIPAIAATLNTPTGIAVDFTGQIYFSDQLNHRIRKINAAGIISTLAGNGTSGLFGDGDLASNAEFNSPAGIALDHEGHLYVADSGNNGLRVVSQGLNFPAVEVGSSIPPMHTIFLRTREAAVVSNPTIPAAQLQSDSPGVTPQPEFSIGNIFGCAMDGTTVNPTGSICAISVTFTPRYPGLRSGAMQFTANNISISVGLYGTGLAPQAVVTPGMIETILSSVATNHGIALTKPQRIATDPAGNIYVADLAANVVWSLQNQTDASPTVIAGGGALAPAEADGGPALDALLQQPSDLALDAAGNLYIAETGANLVRKVNLASGMIATVAGTGTAGYSGDMGAATSANLNGPTGIAANAEGDLFIADTGNHVIRRVYALGGTIFTIAGTGSPGYLGDGGDAIQAELQRPQSVAVDSEGRLYIADTGNNVVRAIDPVTNTITTVAGTGAEGFSGDRGPAVNAELSSPTAIATDAADNLYIADAGNARVRKLDSQSGMLVTLAGSALVGSSGDGGPANAAALTTPTGVAVDSLGEVLLSDPGNDTVRRISFAAPTLDFGAETVGDTTAAQTDSLANIGNQTLSITQFPAAPVPMDFFSAPDVNQCSIGNLVAGSVCDLSFTFQPSAAGPLTEDAWILDNSLNASAAEQVVPMTGNGVSNSPVVTATTVTADPSTVVYGAAVRLTANVTTSARTMLAGTVIFELNGMEVAAVALSSSGVASITLPAISGGSNVVTAMFVAVGNNLVSSGTANLLVTRASSQTTLATSTATMRANQNAILTATVASSTIGVPTGTVVFIDGSTQLGAVPLGPTGQAVLNTQQLHAGMNSITAEYQGDGNFQPSTAASVTVAVANEMLAMAINPIQLNIAGGKTGQTSVILSPKNAFSDTVSLACIGLVRGATCQFSSPTVAFHGQTEVPQTVSLLVDPHTLLVAGIWLPAKTILVLRLLLILLGLAAMLLPFLSRRRAAASGWRRILLVIICVGLGSVLGCANLSVPVPTSDDITVQASTPSQGVVATAQLQVFMAQ